MIHRFTGRKQDYSFVITKPLLEQIAELLSGLINLLPDDPKSYNLDKKTILNITK